MIVDNVGQIGTEESEGERAERTLAAQKHHRPLPQQPQLVSRSLLAAPLSWAQGVPAARQLLSL